MSSEKKKLTSFGLAETQVLFVFMSQWTRMASAELPRLGSIQYIPMREKHLPIQQNQLLTKQVNFSSNKTILNNLKKYLFYSGNALLIKPYSDPTETLFNPSCRSFFI